MKLVFEGERIEDIIVQALNFLSGCGVVKVNPPAKKDDEEEAE